MKNSSIINVAIVAALKGLTVLLSIIVVGMFIPMALSIMVSSFSTKITLDECILSVPFWIGSFIGCFGAIFYVNDEITNYEDNVKRQQENEEANRYALTK